MRDDAHRPSGAGPDETPVPKKIEAYLIHVLSRLKQADVRGAGGALSVRLEIDPSVELWPIPGRGLSRRYLDHDRVPQHPLESEAELAAVLAHEYAHLREGARPPSLSRGRRDPVRRGDVPGV